MIDIVIIDRRETLSSLIRGDNLSVRIFDDASDAYQAVTAAKAGIIFVNYAMQAQSTVPFISLLYRANPDCPIILTATGLGDDRVLDCLAAGAKGYLDLHDAEQFIHKLIDRVLDGEAWISRRLVTKLLQRFQSGRSQTPSVR
ncbi:MAG: response regulator [Gammaproteobacteria bacterium]